MTKLRNKKHDIEAKYISKERTFYLDCVAVMNGGFLEKKKVKRSCLETHSFMSVKMLIKLLQIDISAYNIGTFCYNFSFFMQLIVIAKIKHFWGAMGMQKRFKLNWNNQLMNREKYHVGKIHSHECANDVFWPLGEILRSKIHRCVLLMTTRMSHADLRLLSNLILKSPTWVH